MVKVITYGTYDLLHYGHIRLLERAKALGDYLIVGVTADDYDRTRGKINVQQSLMERIEAVKATGIADEVIVEEYEGQKIDDIRRYGIDIFTVGSDWEGFFDYLKEYCNVIYLPRTQGVSSSEIRKQDRNVRIGLVGESIGVKKILRESAFVNGVEIAGIYFDDGSLDSDFLDLPLKTQDYEKLLMESDAVYIASHPTKHYCHVKTALSAGKHVLCEAPGALSAEQYTELLSLAREKKCILMNGIKTAYSTAYARMLGLVKSGKIGRVVSVDATCTSLRDVVDDKEELKMQWNSICWWGPTAMLPIFQILGTDFKEKRIISTFADEEKTFDLFTKIDFIYDNAVASLKVGKGVKSEGELVVSGTKGYIYIPAPWWKTDYFEARYEDVADTRKYFYQLDGEGIRYELVAFVKSIKTGFVSNDISNQISLKICETIEDFYKKELTEIV